MSGQTLRRHFHQWYRQWKRSKWKDLEKRKMQRGRKHILEIEGKISFLVGMLIYLISIEQKIKEEVKVSTSNCLKTEDLLDILALGSHWLCLPRTFL